MSYQIISATEDFFFFSPTVMKDDGIWGQIRKELSKYFSQVPLNFQIINEVEG